MHSLDVIFPHATAFDVDKHISCGFRSFRLIQSQSSLQYLISKGGDVAQSVEQGIHKPWVTGSSPVVAIQTKNAVIRQRFFY